MWCSFVCPWLAFPLSIWALFFAWVLLLWEICMPAVHATAQGKGWGCHTTAFIGVWRDVFLRYPSLPARMQSLCRNKIGQKRGSKMQVRRGRVQRSCPIQCWSYVVLKKRVLAPRDEHGTDCSTPLVPLVLRGRRRGRVDKREASGGETMVERY